MSLVVAQLPARVLFVGRARLARKRTAAGHIGKKLQFPRTRHSRDRIAERAPRGGGLEICAPSSSLRQLPARVLFVGCRVCGTPVIGLAIRGGGSEICALACFFVGRASLTRKRIAAGQIGKKLQFPRMRHSRDRIAERAIGGRGLRNLRPVIIVAPTSRARAFCRASQLNSKKDCGGPYWKKASVSAHAALP